MSDQVGECKVDGTNAEEPVRGKAEKATISLRPLDKSDLDQVREWRNDHRIWRWRRQNDLISDWDQEKWFERQASDQKIKTYKFILRTETLKSPLFIGVGGFSSIDHMNKNAEFSIYIAPHYQGMQLGKMGLNVLLTHGFLNLGFHTIWGEVFEGNPALKLFESLGFHRDGVRRDSYFREGKYINAHMISIKDTEWKTLSSAQAS